MSGGSSGFPGQQHYYDTTCECVSDADQEIHWSPRSSFFQRLSRSSLRDAGENDRPPRVPETFGLAAGAGAFASQLPFSNDRQAEAAPEKGGTSVNLGVHALLGGLRHRRGGAERRVGAPMEPVFDSPLNLGAHCAKGRVGGASTV